MDSWLLKPLVSVLVLTERKTHTNKTNKQHIMTEPTLLWSWLKRLQVGFRRHQLPCFYLSPNASEPGLHSSRARGNPSCEEFSSVSRRLTLNEWTGDKELMRVGVMRVPSICLPRASPTNPIFYKQETICSCLHPFPAHPQNHPTPHTSRFAIPSLQEREGCVPWKMPPLLKCCLLSSPGHRLVLGEEMRTTTSDIQKVLFSEQYLININK